VNWFKSLKISSRMFKRSVSLIGMLDKYFLNASMRCFSFVGDSMSISWIDFLSEKFMRLPVFPRSTSMNLSMCSLRDL